MLKPVSTDENLPLITSDGKKKMAADVLLYWCISKNIRLELEPKGNCKKSIDFWSLGAALWFLNKMKELNDLNEKREECPQK